MRGNDTRSDQRKKGNAPAGTLLPATREAIWGTGQRPGRATRLQPLRKSALATSDDGPQRKGGRG